MNADTEETCTQYNILKLNSNRFSWDADSKYMDMYARQLYGGMIGNQAITGQWANTNSTGFHYMLPLGGAGLTKPWGDSAQGFPCCWGTSSEAFAGRHIENIFHEVPDHSGVYVQLYEPATLTWPARGAVIKQEASYPASTQFTSRLTVLAAGDTGLFSLLVRVPFWATTGANTATLNGKPVSGVVPGQYLNLTRVWSSGDVLEVYFPAVVRWEQLVDDRPQWAGVGALMYGDFLLAGVNTTEQNLGGVDPAHVTSWVTRVPDETRLLFTITYTSLCGASTGPSTIPAIPLADVVFEQYTVHWHTGSSVNQTLSYNGSATGVLPGSGKDWGFYGAASLVNNGPTQNIRSGDPDEVNSAFMETSVLDPTHKLTGLSLQYQYVSGYGPAGRHVGANFTVLLVEQCAPGASLVPPAPSAIKAVVYSSPELTLYPFDYNNTGYSPLQPVAVKFPSPVDVSNATRVVFVFYDNDRNIQLNLPLDVTVLWD